ncbi:hypothetical protein B9Z19DRAFT_1069555 [Tuber borchii]|uniref:Uncharacterized protein n=1 Tax=Tuber borchii TaxID=42251 RepID=A0A2T6ZB56_TUBBO|nr:hypothetical protein B9Z19DRAFT_1069555 [Tuber borchii]
MGGPKNEKKETKRKIVGEIPMDNISIWIPRAWHNTVVAARRRELHRILQAQNRKNNTECGIATPRSLRSFFDSTPADLLDSQLSSLALISRTAYEQNQAEIATLRKQIEDKENEISSLIVKRNGVGVSTSVGAVGVAIEIGVLEVQITELQKRNEGLVGENKRISKELESSELKGKAIKAEITRLRLDGSKRSKELEERNLKLSAELLDARTAFSQLQQSIGSQSGMTNGHGIGSSGTMMADSEATLRELRSENEKLLTRLRSSESGKADLHRINKELRTVVKTNENSNVDLQKGNLELKVQISSLESDNQKLQKKSAKFDMVVEEKEELEKLVANLRTEIEKLRAIPPVNNNTGALEAEITKLQNEVEHLNSQLKGNSPGFEAANKKLVNDNIELAKENEGLARLVEAEKMKLIARDAEIEILNQRSQRLVDLKERLRDENVALRSQKERLLADLGDMERGLRIYRAKAAEPKALKAPLDKPFEHIPSRKDARRNSGIDSNGAHGKSHENSISPRGQGMKRSLDEMEDSGEEAAGDIDCSLIGGNGNGSSRNFSIRAIASEANGPAPAPPGVTDSPTHISTSVPTSPTGRNLFERVGGLPSRSLFERISLPLKPPPISPVSRWSEDREIEHLVSSTKTGKRCIICRFDGGGNPPDPAGLLSVVCGGPLESLRIMGDRNMGMLCFLRPHNAEEFLDYAERNLNGKRVFRDEHCVVDFLWQDKAIKPIEKEIAHHVVHYSRSRIFKFHCLPYETPLERCLAKITSLIGDRKLWLNEGHRGQRGREVEVEFMSIRDATEAKRLLDTQATAWGGISWCRDECDRPIPT